MDSLTSMKKGFSYFLIIFSIFLRAVELPGQNILKPSIGVFQEPHPTDSICPISNYLGSFDNSGYHLLDTVNDFTLYTQDHKTYTLSDVLADGKPVLLISSSFTCPVFRGKIDEINALQDLYGDRVNIFVVYTVEAHPSQDISPYFGRVNTGQPNINEGILYRQPVTYGERIEIVRDLLKDYPLKVPVLIDGPCNAWWTHFGPAPNNASFMDASGIIQIKHAWFDRDPDDIFCDLHEWFDPLNPCDSIINGKSSFRFAWTSDSTLSTITNGTSYASGTLENVGSASMKIEVKRLLNDLPTGWSSSMCLDVCYPSAVDSTQITLGPGEKLDLILDVFTGMEPDTARIRIGMRNLEDNNNRAIMRLMVVASNPTAISEKELSDIMVFPNPATHFIQIFSEKKHTAELLDDKGTVLYRSSLDGILQIRRDILPSGVYYLRFTNDKGQTQFRKILFL